MSAETRTDITVGCVYAASTDSERILVVSSIPEHGEAAPYFYSHLVYDYGTDHEYIDPLAAGTSSPTNVGPVLSTMTRDQFAENLIKGWEGFHRMTNGADQHFIQRTIGKFEASIGKTIEL